MDRWIPSPEPNRISSRLPKIVFLDAGGTLLHVWPSVGYVYAEAAARHGVLVPPASVDRAFRAAWDRSLDRRCASRHSTSDDVLREDWRIIVRESFSGLLPPEKEPRLFTELYERFTGPEPWSVAEGVLETLAELRGAGIALGVLSNWDSRLHQTLAALGLTHFFDHFIISYEVGLEKPHPGIFLDAARQAGVRPAEILMVGDSLDQDILPAHRLGWQAVWVRPKPCSATKVDVPVGVTIIEDLRELTQKLRRPFVEKSQ